MEWVVRVLVVFFEKLWVVLWVEVKFDDKDPVLGSKYGKLKNIIDLICNEPVEFNLRVDYGLHSDIREFFENTTQIE